MTTRFPIIAMALVVLGLPQQSRADQQGYDVPFKYAASTADGQGLLVQVADCESEKCGEASAAEACGAEACCVPCWRVNVDFLYLRPGNDKVAYAVPINGAIVPPAGAAPVQIGTEGVVDASFNPGIRIGVSRALDDCATLGVGYTFFESTAADQISIDAPYVLRSLIDHPGSHAAPTDFLDASAHYDVRFQLGDVDYRRMLAYGDCYALNYVIGLRYANLRQNLHSLFTNATTIEAVETHTDFDGLGIKLGLEGERHAACSGLMVYGRSTASFVGGVFRGRYLQSDNFRGTVVNTGWDEDRVVSILEAELGVGWTSSNGRIRMQTGYLVSTWLNSISTRDFIRAVQNNASNDSLSLTDTMTFDGVVSRIEVRY